MVFKEAGLFINVFMNTVVKKGCKFVRNIRRNIFSLSYMAINIVLRRQKIKKIFTYLCL